MKANELRIGNLLQGEPILIPKLDMYGDGIMAITGEGISLMERGVIIDRLHPIPLTEEWLLKFGFVIKNIHSTQWGDLDVFCLSDFYIIKRDGEFYHMIDCEDREYINWHTKLPYLHSFQNLYFALIGEELEIK